MAPYHTAEENEIERLRYQIAAQEDAYKDEFKLIKWQLRREQDRSKQLQIDLKHAATDQRSALADLEHERIMRQIDLEQMSQKAIEIAQFAVAATTEAAAKEHNAKVEDILAKNAKSKQIHEQKVKDLKERATNASAELHRLQSNVATMLEETRVVCESQRVESQECIETRHREELGRLKSAHRQEKKQLDHMLDQEKLMGKCRGLRHTTCTAVCMNHFYTEYRFRLIKQSATLFHPHFSSRIINTLVLFFP